MDARIRDILSQQQAVKFADLAGSEVQATVRLSDRLLNESIARFLPPALHALVVRSQTANRIDATVRLARASFLPIPVSLAIERQPQLPGSPLLVLRVIGGLGGVMRLAGSMVTARLPPGVRMDGSFVTLDLGALLRERGLGWVLDYARELQVTTEQGGLAVSFQART